MTMFDPLVAQAKSASKTIVLPESGDPRILQAAAKLIAEGVADVMLVGDPESIQTSASEAACDISSAAIINPHENTEEYAETFFELRKSKGVTREQAGEVVRDPLVFANLMVRRGEVDGCVAGAQYATADVVRSALQIVGKHPDYSLVSSFFMMLFDKPFHAYPGIMIFADCGLVIDPNAEQLGNIAAATADTARNLLGLEPRVAMLSFSTRGSAKHELVDKVVEATRVAKSLRPEFDFFGDVQLDAAIVPEVLAQKAPEFASEKQTNVLVFPGLEAANIGYKLVQRFAQAEAIGPILQGLNKPVNDLSRGCSADDVYRAAVVTAVQASGGGSRD
ncbi:MAG: phosphate acetyltransferase [Pseudomonadota bacterium]